MLIDEFLPSYQVAEHHELLVRATPARAYAAIWEADLAASPIVKALFSLRAVPALLSAPTSARLPTWQVTLREILQHGFRLLAEDPEREVVLGVAGRFWQLTGNLATMDADDFRKPLPPGTARAAWNFLVSEKGHDSSLVATETRISCADDASLRSLRGWPCGRGWRRAAPECPRPQRSSSRTAGRARARAGRRCRLTAALSAAQFGHVTGSAGSATGRPTT